MLIPRLYTDEAGDSRFDSYEVALELHDHAPPATQFLSAEPMTATKYVLFRIPPGWVGAQHSTPNTRLVIWPNRRLEAHWKHWRDAHLATRR